MLLSARMLNDCTAVNSWEVDNQISWTQGDTLTVYFMLVNASLDTAVQGYNPAGRRYIPATGATLTVTLENIDNSIKLTRLATQPFTGDGSIWSLQILPTDVIQGTPQMRFTLNENGVITSGLVKNGLRIYSTTNC